MTTSPRPLVIAHRGASGYRPEHSRAAYELAISLGADALEPDIVATKDGVLVLRHENEISGTTDVAAHPRFAKRRTTKVIDGQSLTGWFTEDFTWAELSTLRTVERLPEIRPASARFDRNEGILRLVDLIDLMEKAAAVRDRVLVMVAEIKHATYFESIGLPLDELFAEQIGRWATPHNLIVECFEQSVLQKIRARGVPGRLVFLAEENGAPADLVAEFGAAALPYAAHLTDEGLSRLAAVVDGVSVNKNALLQLDAAKRVVGTTDLVSRAHDAGLLVFCWTLRAENKFLAKNLRVRGSSREFGNWFEEYALLMRTGVDGVFADQPDLALLVRASLAVAEAEAEA